MRKRYSATVATIALAVSGCDGAGEPTPPQRLEDVDRRAVDRLARTPGREPYYLGDTFEGVPLSRVEVLDAARTGLAVIFEYERCATAATGAGIECRPFVKVGLWRQPRTIGRAAACAPLTIRGVPARVAPGGYAISLYTGRGIVVVSGEEREDVRRAAHALRRVDGARPSSTLPPPPRAVTAALRRCSR